MRMSSAMGIAAVSLMGVVGYGAMSLATGSSVDQGDAGDPSAASSTRLDTVASEPFEGSVTQSGGFTGDVVEGDDDAPITIIEYTSFTCPHCKAFHEKIYTPFKADYIDSGKVRFIYRDFPLDNLSLAVSMISRCGGAEKYLGFADLFMTEQDRWRRADEPLAELKKLAKLGGLGSNQIDACLADDALGQSILDRAGVGEKVFGVNATPTVLLNGKKFDGAMTLGNFTATLDKILEQ